MSLNFTIQNIDEQMNKTQPVKLDGSPGYIFEEL